jgi:tetratricopeptide (TPR) repeat protein
VARQAVNLDNRDAGARFSLGRLYCLRREHDSAIFELRTAIDLNPSFADAYYGLGICLVFAGRPAEGIEPLKTTLRLSPHDPHLWIFYVCLALAHNHLHDYETSLGYATSALREPAAEITANVLYASALGHLGRRDEGEGAIADLLKRNPDFSGQFLHKIFPYKDEADFEHIMTGLHKAGLAR